MPPSAEILKQDLQTERPVWPLSSYGLKYDTCLIPGIDVAPDEMRWEAYQALKSGGGGVEAYVSWADRECALQAGPRGLIHCRADPTRSAARADRTAGV